jgi:hypothetical protein
MCLSRSIKRLGLVPKGDFLGINELDILDALFFIEGIVLNT